MIGSSLLVVAPFCLLACTAARQTSIAVTSLPPILRNTTSRAPVWASKYHRPFLETRGIGKGQFSAPMYRTVVPSGADQTVHLLILLHEPVALALVRRFVAARRELLSGAEDR